MSNKIKIQPEFDAKLKKLRIKTKFMNNFGKWVNKSEERIALRRRVCLNTNKWDEFINYAFNWRLSPEGTNFWNNISHQ